MRTEAAAGTTPRSCGLRSTWPWLALAAVLVLQLFLPGAQSHTAALISPSWDKFAHLAFYSLITVLLWQGTAGRMPYAVTGAVIAIGALDELHQASLPARHADALDFLVDVCAAVGTVAAIVLRSRWQLRPR